MPDSSHNAAKFDTSRELDEQGFRQLLRRATVALVLALGLPLLVLLGLVFVLLSSAKWVDHSDQIIAGAHRLNQHLTTIQTNFRGFRLASEAVYLERLAAHRAEVEPGLSELHQLVSDNSYQKVQVEALRSEVREWLEFVDAELESIRVRPGTVQEPTFLRRGVALFDAVQNRLDKMVGEEKRLRKARSLTLEREVTALLTVLAISALAGIPGLTLWLQKLLRKAASAYQGTLETSERRAGELQVTLRSIGDAVISTDTSGNVDFLNPVAEALTGWNNSEAQGRPLDEVFAIYNEETGARAENPVERVLRENIVIGLANHTVLRSKQGGDVPIEDSAAPIRNDAGEVRGVILVFHDVTAKRDADSRIQEGRKRDHFLNEISEKTRELLDVASILEVVTTLLGTHLKVSRCAYAEVESETDDFVIPHDYTDHCASTVGHYKLSLFGPRAVTSMHGGSTLIVRDVDTELGENGGGEMFSAIGIKAIVCCPLVKEGRLRAMMAVHQVVPRDWTPLEIGLIEDVVERCWATIERARAEAESREQAKRFRLLSEVVSIQFWTADLKGDLDYVNQECIDYFGVSRADEVLGTGWVAFVHPDDIPGAARYWESSLKSGNRYEVEFRLRDQNGDYRWFIARAEAMRNAEGTITKWFGTNTDIQDLKMAQSKAEEANRAKDSFLAALSHELRTPLTPVLMTASILRDDERIPDDLREQIAIMERNITLEARLIDDLLDVTSITQGKLQLRTKPCDAHELISLATGIVRKDAVEKNIVIECQFEARRHEIPADPARFQQVIWNLVRNSVKFTPPGGTILIRTRDEEAGRLRVEVTDSGIGIEPNLLKQIFKPFEQGGLTGDHRFGGMGLGLSIARAILEAQGGTIHATSKGTGFGSTFVIQIQNAKLPSETSQPAPKGTETSNPTAGKKEALRLLLVEDHESTLLVLARLLTRIGYTVVTASRSAEAQEAAANQSFDLVISDLGLPDGSGLDLMRKLRDRHGLRGIALSGYGMEQDLASSREAGFIIHLVKPVDFPQLRQAIETLLVPREDKTFIA